MTDTELSVLEAAAKAATPGPWVQDCEEVITENNKYVVKAGDGTGGCTDEDARYIAAANPAVILALIQEVRKLQCETDALLELMNDNIR